LKQHAQLPQLVVVVEFSPERVGGSGHSPEEFAASVASLIAESKSAIAGEAMRRLRPRHAAAQSPNRSST